MTKKTEAERIADLERRIEKADARSELIKKKLDRLQKRRLDIDDDVDLDQYVVH
jgi:hypothetical protein